MWANLINTAIGVVIGLVTGFYFERRSTRATRQHNHQLEEELAALRTSVYSVGADVTGTRSNWGLDEDSLTLRDAVLSRARSIQDAQGRVSKTLLTSYFFARGHRSDDVDHAIKTLCEGGSVREDGKWLEVK